MSEIQNQLNQIGSRLSTTEMIDNVFDNFLYTVGESIGNSVGGAVTWKLLSTIEEATGGIHLPAISVFGNMVDLATFTIEGIAKTGIFGLSALANLGTMITSISNGGGLDLDAWGGTDYTKRGGDFVSTIGGVQKTKSGSRAISSASSSDTKKSAIASTEEDQESQKRTSKEFMADEISIETLYNELFENKTAIYTIDNPANIKLVTLVVATNSMRDKVFELHNLMSSNGKGIKVEVTNPGAFPRTSIPDKISLSDESIGKLGTELEIKIVGNVENPTNNNGSHTISDLVNLLANGTIHVSDDDVTTAIRRLNAELI